MDNETLQKILSEHRDTVRGATVFGYRIEDLDKEMLLGAIGMLWDHRIESIWQPSTQRGEPCENS